MKNAKRFISIAILSTMLVSTLTACSEPAGSASQASTGGDTQSTAASQSDEPEEMEPITYEIYLSQSIAEYPPDGGLAKEEMIAAWEEDLGITNTDFNVTMAGGSDYMTKLNALLAGGNTPDYFTLNVTEIQNLVNNKVITPIDDFIPNMPNYQKALEGTATKMGYDNFMVDGQHYAFVNRYLEGELNAANASGMGIREDWLTNLGLDVPVTLDDYYDVLTAFTFDDPDGNGQNDTYGLGGHKGQMFSSVFGAYGIYMNGVNSWSEVDGQLVHNTTLPEVKEVLTTLNKWYKDGIIDPDKFIIESKQTKDKFIGGQIGAYETSVWWTNDARIAWSETNPDYSTIMIAPPEGPEGDAAYPVNPVASTGHVISRNAAENKDIDRLTKILDWTCNTEEDGGMMLVTYGIEDTHYAYDEATDFIDQSLIDDYVELYQNGFSNPVRWITVVDRRWIPADDGRAVDFTVTGDEDLWVMTEFSGSVEAMKDYPDLYTILWDEYFTKIVIGELPVDAFDEYVTRFFAEGGTELTEQVNAAWAALQ